MNIFLFNFLFPLWFDLIAFLIFNTGKGKIVWAEISFKGVARLNRDQRVAAYLELAKELVIEDFIYIKELEHCESYLNLFLNLRYHFGILMCQTRCLWHLFLSTLIEYLLNFSLLLGNQDVYRLAIILITLLLFQATQVWHLRRFFIDRFRCMDIFIFNIVLTWYLAPIFKLVFWR